MGDELKDLVECRSGYEYAERPVALLKNVQRLTAPNPGFMTGPGTNAALFIAPDLGPSSPGPVLLERNYLDGGGYTVHDEIEGTASRSWRPLKPGSRAGKRDPC